MSRFEEVVNEAIGEVVLNESPFRAETLAQHIAELVRSRQGAERAEVTIAARYPEHKPAPVSGMRTQEIYTLYGRAVAYRARDAAAGRGVGHRHDRLPVRPGAGGRARTRATARRRVHRRADRARSFERVPVATHNQRGLATLHIGCLEECVAEIDASALLAIAEASHVLGDLRADEALRRGRGGGEGPSPPALRRGLRARDDRERRRAASPSSTARASSRPARRTWRRSTSTTSSPSATACSPSCAPRSARAGPPRITRASRSGWRRRLGARAQPERRAAPGPAACAGAGRRSSRGPTARSRGPSRTGAPRPTAAGRGRR